MAAYGMTAGVALSSGLTEQGRRRGSIWRLLRLMGEVAAERRALREMDQRTLRDLGLTDEMARAESERSLFDLPTNR